MGGPLVININGGAPIVFTGSNPPNSLLGVTAVLGNQFSTHTLTVLNPIDITRSPATSSPTGPVPVVLAGNVFGSNNITVGDNDFDPRHSGRQRQQQRFHRELELSAGSGRMLRLGSATAIGNGTSVNGVAGQGTLDLNGFSVTGKAWTRRTGSHGPLSLPSLINGNTTHAGHLRRHHARPPISISPPAIVGAGTYTFGGPGTLNVASSILGNSSAGTGFLSTSSTRHGLGGHRHLHPLRRRGH